MSRLIDADALKYEPLPKDERNYRTFNLDDAYEDGYHDAMVDIWSAPTIEPQRWIPCNERLPEESGLYIVTNVGRWVEPVGTRYYNIRADGGFWSGHPSDKVLAWMPLPEPYKEAET